MANVGDCKYETHRKDKGIASSDQTAPLMKTFKTSKPALVAIDIV